VIGAAMCAAPIARSRLRKQAVQLEFTERAKRRLRPFSFAARAGKASNKIETE